MPESSKILRYGVGIVHFGAQHRAIIDIHNPQRLYYTRFFWRSSFLAAFACVLPTKLSTRYHYIRVKRLLHRGLGGFIKVYC